MNSQESSRRRFLREGAALAGLAVEPPDSGKVPTSVAMIGKLPAPRTESMAPLIRRAPRR